MEHKLTLLDEDTRLLRQLVTRSGEPFVHDIVDHFPTAAADLLSMGKLLTVGWTFNLNKADMYATLPGGERVTLQLSDDNLLILPHQE